MIPLLNKEINQIYSLIFIPDSALRKLWWESGQIYIKQANNLIKFLDLFYELLIDAICEFAMSFCGQKKERKKQTDRYMELLRN